MCDHRNQASLISSVCASGDVTINISGDVHARAGDDGASNQLCQTPQVRTSTACIHNEGDTHFLQAINKVMWDRVNSNMGFLKTKLDFQVYPQIAESPGFYEGKHVVDITEPKCKKVKLDLRWKEYVKDGKFQWSETDCKIHSFKSIMKEFCTDVDQVDNGKLGVMGLFAQAGSGKTTCMRHWAKHTMIDNQISPDNSFCSMTSENPRFSLVLYYDLKNLRNELTILDFLLGGFVSDREKDIVSKWLLNNDSKVIIFFDGLDQATWTIGEEHEKEIGPHTQTDVPTIMYSILSRNSLSRARVILSSREFKAATLPYFARPHRIITLTGFSNKDAKALFNAQVSKNFHEDPWEEISRTSSCLQHFLTIPMFLTFAALVYVHSEGLIPKNVTELLVKVLEQLERCKNIQERKDIWETISKLKGLAHQGMEKSLVVFTIDDLSGHNISLTQVRDLLLMVPSSNIMNQCLLDGDYRLFFCHQTIQEILSACVIVELPLQRFTKFVQDQLLEDSWSVVCRFVCGLLFMKSPNKKFLQISDASEKQNFVRESLMSLLKKDDFTTYKRLETYASIHESNDDVLIKSLRTIKLSFLPNDQAAAHLIGSLINRTERLDKLSLPNHHDDFLNIITSNVKNVIHINEIILSPGRLRISTVNNFFHNTRANAVIIGRPFREFDERLDMRNISRVLLVLPAFRFLLTNCSDTVKIRTPKGCYSRITFNMKEETLSVIGDGGSDLVISLALHSSKYLKPRSISFVMNETLRPQYILLDDVIAVLLPWESVGVVKVDEIVLHVPFSYEMNELTEDCIAKIVQWLSVKTLHVTLDWQQYNKCYEMSKAKLDASICQVNIWLCAGSICISDLCDFLLKNCICDYCPVEWVQLHLNTYWYSYDCFSSRPAAATKLFIGNTECSKILIASVEDGYPNDRDKEILLEAAKVSGYSLEFGVFKEWGEAWNRAPGILWTLSTRGKQM